MSNYRNAGEGLQRMIIAAIGSIICGFLIPMPIVGFLCKIGIIVFFIVDITGYRLAGKDIVGCKVAFFFVIFNLILSVIDIIVPGLSGITNLVGGLLSFAAISLVFFSVAHVLRQGGHQTLAKKGIIAWVVYLFSTIVNIVLEVVGIIVLLRAAFSDNTDSIIGNSLTISLTGLVVSVVALVFQLKFYKAASEQFGTYF